MKRKIASADELLKVCRVTEGDEVHDWRSVRQGLEDGEFLAQLSEKYDGITQELVEEAHTLAEAHEPRVVLELHHRGPPCAWYADGEKDFTEKVFETFNSSLEDRGARTFDNAREQLGRDLKTLRLLTEEEARLYRGEGSGEVEAVLKSFFNEQ